MRSYLVEAYMPATARIEEVEARVRQSVEALAKEGVRMRYVRSIFVPGDETCFHLLDGPSAEVVENAVVAAGITADRVVAAFPNTVR